MSEIVLVNPRKRRSKTRRARKARASNPARRRVHVRRRRNPIALAPVARRMRRKVRRMHARRRRNPISLGGSSLVSMLKGAFLGGAGSVAVDAIMGQIRPMLPASLNTGYGYQAAKMGITVALGMLGRKVLGTKAVAMAEGALTVQAASLIRGFLPATMSMGFVRPPGRPGLGLFQQANLMPAQPNVQRPSTRLQGIPTGARAMTSHAGIPVGRR